MPALLLVKSPPTPVMLVKPPALTPLVLAADRPYIIGRQAYPTATSPAADLLLDDGRMAVGRHHVLLTKLDNQVFVQDVSRGGSRLNDRNVPHARVGRSPIKHGDVLKICDFHLMFVDDCHIVGQEPFAPRPFADSWRTEHTVGLAARMQETGDLAALPILADALEEAGCENDDILTHCREPGVHVRGCWVIDLVLGKA